MLKYIQVGDFMRRDEVKDLCGNLVQNIYSLLGSRDESINKEIARMNSKIEGILLENNIGARQRQVIIEKFLGDTAENISKQLNVKREDIYGQMSHTLNDLYDTEKEIEDEGTDKTRAMLNEQNNASQISISNMEIVLDKAISNSIIYLSQVGIPDEVLVEIKGQSEHIKNNALSAIENEVNSSGKSIEQVIDETLEEIHRQTLETTEEKREKNPWELSLEEQEAFKKGEQDVLEKYEAGELGDTQGKQEVLRADDIF